MAMDPRHTPLAEHHQVCQPISKSRHSGIHHPATRTHCHSKAIGQHLLSMLSILQQAKGYTILACHNPAGDMLGRHPMAHQEVLNLVRTMPQELQRHQAKSLLANTRLQGISSSTSLQLPAKPGHCMVGLQYSPTSTAS